MKRAQTASEPQLWERQKGESEKAFAAFSAYLSQTHHSLKAVAADRGHSLSTVKRWSARWRWVERSLAHERSRRQGGADARRQKPNAERETATWRRHLKEARQFQQLARGAMTQLVALDAETGQPTLNQNLTANEIVALHKYGSALERSVLAAAQFEVQPLAPETDEEDLDGTPEQWEATLWSLHRFQDQEARRLTKLRRHPRPAPHKPPSSPARG